jgi:hypothetical protein
LVGLNFSHIAPHKAFHYKYWEGKEVEWIGFERQDEMRVQEQDERKFIFELGLAIFLRLALNFKISKIRLKVGSMR